MGGGVGCLVWAVFLGAFPSGWDFSNSLRVDPGLRYIPMSSGRGGASLSLACLSRNRVAKVTQWNFKGQRLVEDFKVVFRFFRVRNFNDLFLPLS